MGEPRAYMAGIDLAEKNIKEKVFYIPKHDILVVQVINFDSLFVLFDTAYEDLVLLWGGEGEIGLEGENLIYLGDL